MKGFRSTQISSVGAGAADPPCDGERCDGLMSAPRDPWCQSRESSHQACVALCAQARSSAARDEVTQGPSLPHAVKVWGPQPCPGVPALSQGLVPPR